jgi:hypothetical protein
MIKHYKQEEDEYSIPDLKSEKIQGTNLFIDKLYGILQDK